MYLLVSLILHLQILQIVQHSSLGAFFRFLGAFRAPFLLLLAPEASLSPNGIFSFPLFLHIHGNEIPMAAKRGLVEPRSPTLGGEQ